MNAVPLSRICARGRSRFKKNIYISNPSFKYRMVLRQLTKEQAKEEVKKLYEITKEEKKII